jgi:hypothetical protein
VRILKDFSEAVAWIVSVGVLLFLFIIVIVG